MSFLLMPHPIAARRAFLGGSGALLSGAAVALLAGQPALAAQSEATGADAQILNTALGAELEAIAAYQLGAQSKLLQKPALDLALAFQGHHQEHAELLAKACLRFARWRRPRRLRTPPAARRSTRAASPATRWPTTASARDIVASLAGAREACRDSNTRTP